VALTDELSLARWRPLSRGEAGHFATMLMAGFTTAYWMQVHGRCYTTIAKWRADAKRAAELDPELEPAARAAMSALSPADGMYMARIRGPSQMPFWSRLAVVEYRKHGYDLAEIAGAFCCAPRTVGNIVHRGMFLSPHRALTEYQRNPPAKRPARLS
jgi:hypothetical protein